MVRQHVLSALIVGARGVSVLQVVTAFEAKRILTLRADTIAAACEQLAVAMPHVVLVLVPPANDAEADALTDRALAVGAPVFHVDPSLDERAFKDVLDRAVLAALERKLARDLAEIEAEIAGPSMTPDALDEGWG